MIISVIKLEMLQGVIVILSGIHYEDGAAIRHCASQNIITMLISLDAVKMLFDELERVTVGILKTDEE